MACTIRTDGYENTVQEVVDFYLTTPDRLDDIMLTAQTESNFINGVPFRHQLEMAETIVSFFLRDANIFDLDASGKQRLTKKDVKQGFAKQRKILTKSLQEDVLDILDEDDIYYRYAEAMLNEWDKIDSLAMRVLISKGLFTVKGDLDSLLESLDESDFRHFNEDFQFERDLKDNMSFNLKVFLAQIDSGKITMFGFPLFMDMNEVYVSVRTMLSGVYPDYNEMKSVLQTEVQRKPWLNEVIKRLDENESIRNEFVTNMTSHPVKMFFVNAVQNEDGEIVYKITESNRNTLVRIITENWKNDVLNNQELYYFDVEQGVYKLVGAESEGENFSHKFLRKYLDASPSKANFKKFWQDLGIELSSETIDYISENGFYSGKTKYTINNFFTDPNINLGSKKVISIINTLFETKATFSESNIFDNGLLGPMLAGLAEIESKYSADAQLASFRTGDKSIASHVLNRYAVNRVRDLKNDENLREQLKKGPYTNSELLSMLDDSTLRAEFDIAYPDIAEILQEGSDTKNKELRKLTPEQIIKVSIILHQNNGRNIKAQNGKTYRIAKMFYPTMSDKKNKYILSMPLEVINDYNFFSKNGEFNDETVEYIFNTMVLPEARRINAELAVKERNISGYDEGRFKFFHFDELNYDENNDNGLYYSDGERVLLKNIDPIAGEVDPIIKETIYRIIRTHLQNEFELLKTKYEGEFKIATHKAYSKLLVSYGVDSVLDTAVADFMLSSLVTNMYVTQNISGDPALFWKKSVSETWDNYAKRWAKDNAPGLEIDDTKDKNGRNKYNVLFVNDVEVPSEFLKNFTSLGISGYEEMNTTDAQSLIALDEWAHILFRKGDITKEEYNTILDNYKNDKNIDSKLLSKLTNVFKPVITSTKFENGIERHIYIKFSSYPLIPQLTKGTDLEDVRLKMKNQGIQMLSFKSAAKLGAPKKLAELFSEGAWEEDSIVELDRYGFKIQQEVPYKESNFINRGTQFTKLIFNGLKDIEAISSLEEEYDNLYSELIEYKRKELEKEILHEDGSLNFDRLNELIKEELIERKYDAETLKYFTKVQDQYGSNFAYPFFAHPQKKRIEPVINSLIDNRIRKLKFPGKSYVLASRTGYKTKALTLEDYKKSGGQIVFTDSYEFGSNLKPQLFKDGKVQRAQVIVPWNFRDSNGKLLPMSNYMTNGKIDFKKLPKELLEIQGFRIPTQGLNSMSAAEIVGFLPEGVTDIVIAPAEYVVQMGSDFDVDKLYTYQRSYSVNKNGELRITSVEEDFELGTINKILDIQDTILTFPDKRVQKFIANKLDYGLFEKDPDYFSKVGSIEREKGPFLTPSRQLTNFVGASSAKDAVGIYSLSSTFNAMIQSSDPNKSLDIIWYRDVLGFYEDFEDFFSSLITFGQTKGIANLSNQKVANSSENDQGRTKADIISAIQSAAVDNENKRFLERIGVNENTIKIPVAMAQLGFNEEIFGTLLNMPFVQNFNEYLGGFLGGDRSFNDLLVNLIKKHYADRLSVASNKEEADLIFQSIINEIRNELSASIQDYQEVIKNPEHPKAFQLNLVALIKAREFNRLGKILGDYQRLLNQDSSGLKKNFFEAIIFANSFQNLIETNDPILPFIGDISDVPKEGYIPISKEEDVYFKPTKLSAILHFNESMFVVNNLYNDPRLSIYNSKTFQKVIDELIRLKKGSGKISIAEKTAFFSENSDIIDSALLKYLLSTNKILFPNGFVNHRFDTKKLLNSVHLISKNKKAIKNPFLNILEIKTSESKGKISREIIYRASRKQDDFDTTFQNALLELFEDDRPIPEIEVESSREFVLDLIRYNFINDPFQRATNFSRFIPISILNNLDIPESIKSFDFRDDSLFQMAPGQVTGFVKQMAQNFPSFLPYLNEKRFPIPSSIPKTIDVIQSQDGIISVLPTSVAMVNWGGNLYQSNGKEFVLISRLFNEWDNQNYNLETKTPLGALVKKPEFSYAVHHEPIKLKSTYATKLVSAVEKNDLKEVLRNIRDNSDLEHYAELANIFIDNPNINDIVISFANVPLGRTSYLPEFNLISVNKGKFSTRDNTTKEKIILHEIVHGLTKKAITTWSNTETRDNLTPKQKESIERLHALYKFFKKDVISAKKIKSFEKLVGEYKRDPKNFQGRFSIFESEVVYSATSLEEFFTGIMTSNEVQEYLKGVIAGQKTLWQKIVDAIVNILNQFGIPLNIDSVEQGNMLVRNAIEDVLTVIREESDITLPKDVLSSKFAVTEITPDNPLLDIC